MSQHNITRFLIGAFIVSSAIFVGYYYNNKEMSMNKESHKYSAKKSHKNQEKAYQHKEKKDQYKENHTQEVFDKKVYDAIIKNPTIIRDAIDKLRKIEAEEHKKKTIANQVKAINEVELMLKGFNSDLYITYGKVDSDKILKCSLDLSSDADIEKLIKIHNHIEKMDINYKMLILPYIKDKNLDLEKKLTLLAKMYDIMDNQWFDKITLNVEGFKPNNNSLKKAKLLLDQTSKENFKPFMIINNHIADTGHDVIDMNYLKETFESLDSIFKNINPKITNIEEAVNASLPA